MFYVWSVELGWDEVLFIHYYTSDARQQRARASKADETAPATAKEHITGCMSMLKISTHQSRKGSYFNGTPNSFCGGKEDGTQDSDCVVGRLLHILLGRIDEALRREYYWVRRSN